MRVGGHIFAAKILQISDESDTVRVILWLDVTRKLPPMLGMLSRIFLGIAFASPSMRKMRRDALVRLQ